MSDDPQRQYFAAKLKKAREAKGLSKTQLAQMVGISRQQIAKYESGQNGIGVEMLAKLSKALEVDADGFFPPQEVMRSLAEPQAAYEAPDPHTGTRKLVEIFRTLPHDRQAELLAAAERLQGEGGT